MIDFTKIEQREAELDQLCKNLMKWGDTMAEMLAGVHFETIPNAKASEAWKRLRAKEMEVRSCIPS